EKGVFPPEGGVNPVDALKILVKLSGKEAEFPILVEKIDEKGNKEIINPLSLLSNVIKSN
ncbi:MAG TPA: hypothetical protein PLI22_05370, partial [Caldisericia bacterium]|nr:hypothetical protein [Caldisericia bacterium]